MQEFIKRTPSLVIKLRATFLKVGCIYSVVFYLQYTQHCTCTSPHTHTHTHTRTHAHTHAHTLTLHRWHQLSTSLARGSTRHAALTWLVCLHITPGSWSAMSGRYVRYWYVHDTL